MKIRFFPTDMFYNVEDNRVVTYIVGKGIDDKRICLVDDSYLPYFFIIGEKISTLANEIKNIRIQEKNNLYYVQRTEIVERNLKEKKVSALKVYVNRPQAVRRISEQLSSDFKLYEHDVLFERKYLIDRKIIPFTLYEANGEPHRARIKADITLRMESISNVSSETLKPKIMAIDIETLYKREAENNPVIMISFYTNSYHKTITYARVERENTEKVRSEADLLLKFKEEIEEYKPDILVGYNSDDSIARIKERADRYELNMDLGVDYSQLKISRSGRARILGIAHMDLLKFIKNILSESLEAEDYDLEYISYELLGEDIEYNTEELANVLKEEDELKNYIRDVEYDAKLIYSLTLNVLPNIFELIKLVNLSLFDICRTHISQVVENYIIRHTRELNQLVLNRPGNEEAEKRKKLSYEESSIIKPTPGIYKNLAEIDFKNHQSDIIVAQNISPETIDSEQGIKEKVPGKDYWISKENKGIIPKVIEELINRRRRIEEIMDKNDPLLKARIYSMQLLANSFFNYFSFSGARWYCIKCAEAINAYENFYINKLIDEASEQKYKVIYRDNDSLFMIIRRDQAKIFISTFNNKLPENLNFNFDNFFSAGIFVSLKDAEEGATKKYALIDNGKLKIKGLEAVRKNTPAIVKEIQKMVLKDVLQEKDEKETLEKVKKLLESISENEIPKEKMVLQTKLQKSLEEYEHKTPYVAAARMMKDKGYGIGEGSIIKYIVTKGADKISKRVKLPEDTTQYEYDPDYYIHNQIIPALEPIFKILDVSKEELLKGKDQSKLDSYFEEKK